MYMIFCPILMKIDFSRQILKKYSNIKLHENPSVGAKLLHAKEQLDGRTDTTKRIVVFRNFTNSPKN
jgi:hypothetical protein